MIKELILLANALDKKGFRKEVDFVDALIKRASESKDLPALMKEFLENAKFIKNILAHILESLNIKKIETHKEDIYLVNSSPINLSKVDEEKAVFWDAVQKSPFNKDDIENIKIIYGTLLDIIEDIEDGKERILHYNTMAGNDVILDSEIMRFPSVLFDIYGIERTLMDGIYVLFEVTEMDSIDCAEELEKATKEIGNKYLSVLTKEVIENLSDFIKAAQSLEDNLRKKEVVYDPALEEVYEEVQCPECEGTGGVATGRPLWTPQGYNLDKDEMTFCRECEGEGTISAWDLSPFGQI